MNCPSCSAQMPDISSFCPACGRSVESSPLADNLVIRAGNARDAVLGAVSYIGLLPAILFLSLPAFRTQKFICFHSWQSILFSIATIVIALLMRVVFAFFSLFTGIGFLFGVLSAGLVFLAIVFLWVVLVIKALQGNFHELPWLGRIAARLCG